MVTNSATNPVFMAGVAVLDFSSTKLYSLDILKVLHSVPLKILALQFGHWLNFFCLLVFINVMVKNLSKTAKWKQTSIFLNNIVEIWESTAAVRHCWSPPKSHPLPPKAHKLDNQPWTNFSISLNTYPQFLPLSQFVGILIFMLIFLPVIV